MKKTEKFEDLLKADQRCEKFILGGEIAVLLFVTSVLIWCFWNIFSMEQLCAF